MDKKKYLRRFSVVRITYEPDYDDEAWATPGSNPSVESNPGAFYKNSEPLYPRKDSTTRRKRPSDLSRRKIKSRLANAGVRGKKLRELSAAVNDQKRSGIIGTSYLGHTKDGLVRLVGKRLAHKLMKGVAASFLILDEYHNYASTGAAALFAQATSLRKMGARSTVVVQEVSDFSAKV